MIQIFIVVLEYLDTISKNIAKLTRFDFHYPLRYESAEELAKDSYIKAQELYNLVYKKESLIEKQIINTLSSISLH